MAIRTSHFIAGAVVAVLTVGVTAAAAQDDRLVAAAASQDREVVLTLLDEGVDVNAARADGTTALLWAAHWDDVDLAERLLAAGADVNAADDRGVTAFERAPRTRASRWSRRCSPPAPTPPWRGRAA